MPTFSRTCVMRMPTAVRVGNLDPCSLQKFVMGIPFIKSGSVPRSIPSGAHF